MGSYKRWTEEEDELLCNTDLTYRELNELLTNRSVDAIMDRCSLLGINENIKKEFVWSEQLWSDKEIELLINVYPNIPNKDLPKYFVNRTEGSIYTMANRLGLAKNYQFRNGNLNNKIEDEFLFDSQKEKEVYYYLKQYLPDIIKFNIREHKYYNSNYNEYYLPDFHADNNKIVIEYYGLFDINSNSDLIKKYTNKVLRKNDFFKNYIGITFLDLYPSDIENNFEGINNKLMPLDIRR